MTNELLTVKQAAEKLSLSDWTVKDYIRQGLLKAHKIGANKQRSRWRIWQTDLESFINRHSNVKGE